MEGWWESREIEGIGGGRNMGLERVWGKRGREVSEGRRCGKE